MFRSFLVLGFLMNQAGAEPAGGGGGAPPPPVPPPPAPAPAPGQPFAVFHNQAAFTERVEREARSILRTTTGIEDPAEIKRRLDRATELETADEARRRESMTEQQRLQADLERERTARQTAETQAAVNAERANVTALCASRGIRNVDYALFTVQTARAGVAQGVTFDPGKHLDELLAKPEFKSAFGIPAEPTLVQPAPVTTSPTPGTPPPEPPRGGTPPPAVDAMSMNPQQFADHLAKMGVSA